MGVSVLVDRRNIWNPGLSMVAVGMRIAPHPPHRSGLEELPHPALALSHDGSAARRKGMTDSGRGYPAVNEAPHTLPRDIPVLTAPSQALAPETDHSVSEVA